MHSNTSMKLVKRFMKCNTRLKMWTDVTIKKEVEKDAPKQAITQMNSLSSRLDSVKKNQWSWIYVSTDVPIWNTIR